MTIYKGYYIPDTVDDAISMCTNNDDTPSPKIDIKPVNDKHPVLGLPFTADMIRDPECDIDKVIEFCKEAVDQSAVYISMFEKMNNNL